MLSEIKAFVKEKFGDIMLFIIIGLLITLAVGAGYIAIIYSAKEPLKIESKINNLE